MLATRARGVRRVSLPFLCGPVWVLIPGLYIYIVFPHAPPFQTPQMIPVGV